VERYLRAMARTELLFEPEIDFELICIVCHQREHRLAWAMNEMLELRFSRLKEDLDTYAEDQTVSGQFAMYGHRDSLQQRHLLLIGNRSLPGSGADASDLFGTEQSLNLMPELPRVDYFLLCKGHWPNASMDDLVLSLRQLKMVITAYRQPTEKLRYVNNLVI
jgi:hypothetical protein